jgi:hypothetical protein
MNRFETFVLGAIVVLVAWAAVLLLDGPDVPKPNVDSAVGKCIQGQRVFYHVTRGEAAETCLADLQVDGERSFIREWSNFKTQPEHW